VGVARQSGQHLGFVGVGQGHVHGIDELDRVLAAGVVAALGHGMAQDLRFAHAQARGNGRQHGFGGVIERQLEFGKAQHGVRLYPCAAEGKAG
jgi:hypothetical protein